MSDDARLGFGPQALASEALRQELLVRSLLLTVRTAIPVKVLAVHPGEGSPPAIGTVDVQPLVQTVDGSGNLWAMAPVYGVPFMRIQAGGTAIVVDPAVNDIGLAVACDRDISGVLASGGQQSGPGSARTHHVSDLVYALSIISAAEVTQYILADASGMTLLSPQQITLQAPTINLDGAVNQTNGNVSMQTKLTVPNVDATSDVTVPNGSVNGHVHPGVQSGGSSTGGMTG